MSAFRYRIGYRCERNGQLDTLHDSGEFVMAADYDHLLSLRDADRAALRLIADKMPQRFKMTPWDYAAQYLAIAQCSDLAAPRDAPDAGTVQS